VSIILLISSLLAAAVEGVPQIPAPIKTIISGITGSVTAIGASGVTTTLNPATILTALQGVITQLKAIPQLPQTTLSVIAGLDDAIAAALAADTVAQQAVNPALLHPITPIS